LNYFDLLIDSAGGANGVTGDYAYYDILNLGLQNGVWGVLTVNEGYAFAKINSADVGPANLTLNGTVTANPVSGVIPQVLEVITKEKRRNGKVRKRVLGTTKINRDGSFTIKYLKQSRLKNGFILATGDGGERKITKQRYDQLVHKKETEKKVKPKEKPIKKVYGTPGPGDTKSGASSEEK
jgi:hypothetical protein